jgi:hypothetical protein
LALGVRVLVEFRDGVGRAERLVVLREGDFERLGDAFDARAAQDVG